MGTTPFAVGDTAVMVEPSRFAGTFVNVIAVYAPQIEGDHVRLPYAVERFDMGLFTIGRISVNQLAVGADGLRRPTRDEVDQMREQAERVIEEVSR